MPASVNVLRLAVDEQLARARLAHVPFWFHSFDFSVADLKVAGAKSATTLQHEWATMRVPALAGQSVLDIGAWDGWFSFQAEAAGAARVVAIDHFVWNMQRQVLVEAYHRNVANGHLPPDPMRVPGGWQPHALPGKAGFDAVHHAIGSRVEQVVADWQTCDPVQLGSFDVVFFLGVLYHLPDPLGGMRKLSLLTRDLAIIETEAIYLPDLEARPFLQFFPFAELNGDITNWFAPNLAAVKALCNAAGFRSVEVSSDYPPPGAGASGSAPCNYRLTVHARR